MLTSTFMWKFFYTICCFLLVFGVQIVKSQPAMPVFDGIDGYWFIEGSAVKKVDRQGTALATYSNIALGNPSFVDVSDPFRIAVFYAESQFLVMLSTNASISGNPISVQDLSLGEVNLLCRSSRGGFWLYIHPRGELIHIEESLKATNLRLNVPHTYEFSSKSFLYEHNGLLYLGSNGDGGCNHTLR